MGKPAARLGDPTAHGGVITLGFPTVLIGGMPAARLGDMHVCPMLTPGVPPIPHVGGPILLGSVGVLIGGMPAARMGDMAMCVGPPSTVIMGCPTVLIGESGGGGGGGGGGGAGAGAAAAASAATATAAGVESTTKTEHWVHMVFQDKTGAPVSGIPYRFTDPSGKATEGVLRTDGTIRRDALGSGQCKVELLGVWNAKWSKNPAEVGDKLKMTASTEGFPGGTKACIEVYKRDIQGPDLLIATLDTTVKNDAVEAEWVYEVPEDAKLRSKEGEPPRGYSAPAFYFEPVVGHLRTRSALLEYRDYIEFTLKDHKGKAIGGAKYRAVFANGAVRSGTLDSNGHAKIEKIVQGEVKISIEPRK